MIAAVGLLLAACGTTDDPGTDPGNGDPTNGTDPGDVVEGGTLRVGAAIDPDGLDPHLGSNATSLLWVGSMFDTLVSRDATGAPAPGLASDWDISDDGLTYTFTLRSGVTFHNGRELTADDVVFSLDRVRDPEGGATNAGNLAAITSVTAESADTVVIELAAPNAAMLSELAFGARIAIIAPESFDNGALTTPIGTGPFVFDDYRRDDSLRVTRNADYWDGAPNIEAIEVSILENPLVRLTAVADGDIDFADGVPPTQGHAFEAEGRLDLQEAAEHNAIWLSINTTKEPFDDPALRRAMMAAVDRNDIVAAGWDGFAECTTQPFFEESPWYLDFEGAPDCSADPDAAQLLADAGYAPGEVTVTIIALDFGGSLEEAQVIASAWTDIGITSNVQEVDVATLLEQGATGAFDAASGPMGAVNDPNRPYTYFDPASALHPFTGPLDLSDLVAAGRQATDMEARQEVYRELLETAYANDSYVYTVRTIPFVALSTRVQGYDQARLLGVVWQGDGDLTDLWLAD